MGAVRMDDRGADAEMVGIGVACRKSVAIDTFRKLSVFLVESIAGRVAQRIDFVLQEAPVVGVDVPVVS